MGKVDQLLEGQRSVVTIFDVTTGKKRVVCTTDYVVEAPNWTPDGKTLIVNARGKLCKIDIAGDDVGEVTGDTTQLIDTQAIPDINNDHVLSPDGKWIYLSANDGHIYKVRIEGGAPLRVSNIHEETFYYFLHGVSPDEKELAFVGVEGEGPWETRPKNIFTIPAQGGPDKRLSDIDKPNDGPEYSPDGEWIYFNSERGATPTNDGAQIFRMKRDGTGIEQLTFDERVNWFPHISLDGKKVVFLSFPSGTQGHPANKNVILRLIAPDGGPTQDLSSFFGGQGTINVNSWAPDSNRFAYVEYPLSG